MDRKKVYLGLGANLGKPLETLRAAIEEIRAIPGIYDLRVSRYYQTTPVSNIPQADYVNGACVFLTSLEPHVLNRELKKIESRYGKVPKEKNAPRYVDIDILLFGCSFYDDGELLIPHRYLMERLFVLTPLLDLTEEIEVPDRSGIVNVNLKEYLKTFSNPNRETVTLL